MSTYQEKIEAKKARYAELAEKATAASIEASTAAYKNLKILPFGQPILVDHSSANKHRRHIAKTDALYKKSSEQQEKAAYYAEKAENYGQFCISSDDDLAIQKLKAEIAEIEKSNEKAKLANKILKSKDTDDIKRQKLIDIGIPDKKIDGIFNFGGRFSTSTVEKRRLEQRVTELEFIASRPHYEFVYNTYTYIEHKEDNRIHFVFPQKVSEDIVKMLKRNAFKWSPTRKAWVRMMTVNALYAAKTLRKDLEKLDLSQ